MNTRLTLDDRGVATYTIDEAATRNALSTKVLEDIERMLTALKGDPAVRVVIFTGAGEVFSSGADRAELGDPTTIEKTTRLLSSVLTLIDDSAVPVVCRVNGAAFGAGLAMVAAADICVAVSDAFFGLPEVRFALVAGPAAAACLGRIGQAAALDVLLTGRRFGAVEAQQMHLLSRVVERGDLDSTVESVVADLLLGDDVAIATTRRVVRQLVSPTLTERLRAVQAASAVTDDQDVGYTRRGISDGGARDVDWRDVPARPRRALPTSEVHPDLRGELPAVGRCVVAVGTFDGVHRGHAELIGRVVAQAKALELPSVVLTFDPNPAELVRPGTHPALLTTIARRAELAAALGVDHFRVIPFDLNVANMEPVEFVRRILIERLHIARVVVGANFHFGYLASGSAGGLAELADRFGFLSETVDLVRDADTVISSTYIRSCVEPATSRLLSRHSAARTASTASSNTVTIVGAGWDFPPPTSASTGSPLFPPTASTPATLSSSTSGGRPMTRPSWGQPPSRSAPIRHSMVDSGASKRTSLTLTPTCTAAVSGWSFTADCGEWCATTASSR